MPSVPATPTAANHRLEWYLQAKLGLFLHWGAYTVEGIEASWPLMTPDFAEAMFKNPRRISQADYIRLPERFNPVRFDANAWVRLAKDAGMRYIVLTSKHHDGFCMFDAPGTDYKITKTPYGKDICLQLAEACAAQGMRLGFYYSPPDMHHPGYRDTSKPPLSNWTGEPKRAGWAAYLDYMESHIRKLLTDYGDVSILWFDGLIGHRKYDPARFHNLIHALSPNTLINDRLGDGYDFITPEQFIPHQGVPVRTGKPPSPERGGDSLFLAVTQSLNKPLIGGWLRRQLDKYAAGQLELTRIPQQEYPDAATFQPWETCMTMGTTWAYNPSETRWKAPETLVRNLVEIASRGGNLLLNIGPTPEGTFPAEAVDRLQYIARWMAKHSEAIYNTTYAPPTTWAGGRITRNGCRFFLHLFQMPENGTLTVEGFTQPVKRAALLNGTELPYRQQPDRLEIDIPRESINPAVSVICLETHEGEPQ